MEWIILGWKIFGSLALGLYLPLCAHVLTSRDEYGSKANWLAYASFSLFVYFALWG